MLENFEELTEFINKRVAEIDKKDDTNSRSNETHLLLLQIAKKRRVNFEGMPQNAIWITYDERRKQTVLMAIA